MVLRRSTFAWWQSCRDKKPVPVTKKNRTVVSSFCQAVEIGKNPVIIGERINPTGKSKFKQALRDHNLQYILQGGRDPKRIMVPMDRM